MEIIFQRPIFVMTLRPKVVPGTKNELTENLLRLLELNSPYTKNETSFCISVNDKKFYFETHEDYADFGVRIYEIIRADPRYITENMIESLAEVRSLFIN